MTSPPPRSFWSAALVVAALGYFVDIYDLVLFSILRVSSIADLGFVGKAILDNGVLLLNIQMAGMLVGGIAWGILGDKKGRRAVLFGSIVVYSIANILNAFVTSIPAYALCRFIAGIGLAGELGAGITLVAEILPKEKRGYGTTLVATVGVSGAIAAGLISSYFDWRTNYLIGGLLGISLLLVRIGVLESDMFTKIKQAGIQRGNFLRILTRPHLLKKYIQCILIGIPNWYVVGILITFSPEISQALGVTGTVEVTNAVVYGYIGLVIGDLSSGILSQLLQSRKKALTIFIGWIGLLTTVLLTFPVLTAEMYYGLCLLLGIGAGFWAVFLTVSAEQFGTNLRATVTTSVPNIVRASVIPMTLLFRYLSNHMGLVSAIGVTGILFIGTALISTYLLEESFHKSLEYVD